MRGEVELYPRSWIMAQERGAVSFSAPRTGHRPVMLAEVLELLRPRSGDTLLDGTVGGGGHMEALLDACGPDGHVIGVDRDADALAVAKHRLAPVAARCTFVHENFSRVGSVLAGLGLKVVDGILLDLGFSSLQVEDARRGFSFLRAGPLDMRMNQQDDRCAADVVNLATERELRRIFREFGGEPAARPLARTVVRMRDGRPLTTTTALVEAVELVIPRSSRGRIHPATRVFQALRIAVNEEVDHLAAFLSEGYQFLRPGGRIAVLSYHSLEDRLVKTAFRRWAAACVCPPRLPQCVCQWVPKVRPVTVKPRSPTPQEVEVNPRARSARLRVVERT